MMVHTGRRQPRSPSKKPPPPDVPFPYVTSTLLGPLLSIGCVVGVAGADLAVAGGEEPVVDVVDVDADFGGGTEVPTVVDEATVSSCGRYAGGASTSWSKHSILQQHDQQMMLNGSGYDSRHTCHVAYTEHTAITRPGNEMKGLVF